MPIREYTDSRGVEWRVWNVSPAHMHPVTRSEDYMADLQDGWLAFESGPEKRRLEAPYPAVWTTASVAVLEDLCRRASVVIRRRARSSSGEHQAVNAAALEQQAVAAAHGSRLFLSPRGREWTVRVHEWAATAGGERRVLRFTADDIVVELSDFPEDWRDHSAGEFALLLLDADPPRRVTEAAGPQRRREDHDA